MAEKLMKIALFVVLAVAAYNIGLSVGDRMKHLDVSKLPAALVESKQGSIVRLVKDDHTFCSATVVADQLIITAAHCVMIETPFGPMMNASVIEIRGNDNKPVGVYATLNFATSQMDQAMLVGDFSRFEHKPIITDFAKLTAIGSPGSTFNACGYPLGGDLVCTRLNFKHKAFFYWAVEGSLYPGMSGGPVMLPDGTLVAVNTAVDGENSIVSPIYNLTKNIRKESSK